MSSYVQNSDVVIHNFTMKSLDGSKSYDLKQQVIQIDIYEDITFPVVRAEFLFNDAVDLINRFPIIGEEIIEIEFSNPGADDTLSYTLHTMAGENQIISEMASSKTYLVKACSQELITNSTLYITDKKKDNTDTLVQNILHDYLNTKKDITVDATKGIQELLFATIRPFQAIDMLRGRAVSSNYKSSSYVFFENQHGFNFVTIEYLMDKNKSKVGNKEFFYDVVGRTDLRNVDYRNIISLQNLSQFDNIKKLHSGSLYNTVRRFDLFTGEVTTFEYKDKDQQQAYKFASDSAKPLNTDAFQGKYGTKPSKALLIPFSSDRPENYIDISLGPKLSFFNKINQNLYRIFINGDNTLAVGDVIKAHIPNAEGDDDRKDNEYIAENYLIAKLRHTIMLNKSGVCSFHNSIEMVKGFYEKDPNKNG